MNRAICVPHIDEDRNEDSYTVTVDYREAVRLGAGKIGAVQSGRKYYYLADDVDEVFRLTGPELAQLGAGEIDGRGSDYSLWCSLTGERVKRPSRRVRAALGMQPQPPSVTTHSRVK